MSVQEQLGITTAERRELVDSIVHPWQSLLEEDETTKEEKGDKYGFDTSSSREDMERSLIDQRRYRDLEECTCTVSAEATLDFLQKDPVDGSGMGRFFFVDDSGKLGLWCVYPREDEHGRLLDGNIPNSIIESFCREYGLCEMNFISNISALAEGLISKSINVGDKILTHFQLKTKGEVVKIM